MDIPYDEFKTGERIRKHPIYQRFTKSNGWGYIELLGKGSLDEKAIYVKRRKRDRREFIPFTSSYINTR